MEEKILIADDEKGIVDALAYALQREGYIVEKAYDGKEALEKYKSSEPVVVIIDIMMPKISGYDVCRAITKDKVGILMLTAKNDIVDKVLGLELGADDYITKPFHIKEVIARVKSLIRRFNKSAPIANEGMEIIKIKDLVINSTNRQVEVQGKQHEFTAKEFDLIYKLLSNRGRVYSRTELLDQVWGIEYVGGTRTVDTHIQRIRKKLGIEYEGLIITVHGIGYKGETIHENGY